MTAMRRRTFLPLCLASFADAKPLPIRKVEFLQFSGTRPTESGVNKQHQVNPLHIYDDLRPKEYRDGTATTAPRKIGAIYLRMEAGDIEGWYGPIDREAAIVVQQQISRFLIGKDAMAGEALWDQMHRLNRHSRAGTFLMAISAVDNVLWDIRGRALGAPVYRLLGGPTRSKVAVYGSCLGFSVELDKVRTRSQAMKALGFRHQKWFMAYGPGDGAAGLKKNVALVKTLRESVGDDVDLMFDAFMGWDLNYALSWAKQVEQYRPRWIEEAFAPDKIESFAALRRATSIPVASGEHIYGRWEAQRYFAAGALNVIQADPEWCGGVSELVKICTLASTYDAHVIPHGHSVHSALHVVASQSPMTCPLVEYLYLKMASYHHFEKNPPQPDNGYLSLPDRPGFGIEIDKSKVEQQTVLTLG